MPLMEDLKRIVRRGYAIDDEEDTEGVVCIGTCVFDRTGAAAGAISVTFLKHGGLENRLEELAPTVIRFADRLSRELGGPSVSKAWSLPRPETPPE
jgi:IclR family acetate operon transcriptional repressor